jgi:hypothetical protein
VVGPVKSLDEAPFLDFFGPGFVANPGLVIDEFRRRSCLARTPVCVIVVELLPSAAAPLAPRAVPVAGVIP